MTKKEKIEEYVFCYCCRGHIEELATQGGFKGNVKKANRCDLEKFVIDYLCGEENVN